MVRDRAGIQSKVKQGQEGSYDISALPMVWMFRYYLDSVNHEVFFLSKSKLWFLSFVIISR